MYRLFEKSGCLRQSAGANKYIICWCYHYIMQFLEHYAVLINCCAAAHTTPPNNLHLVELMIFLIFELRCLLRQKINI